MLDAPEFGDDLLRSPTYIAYCSDLGGSRTDLGGPGLASAVLGIGPMHAPGSGRVRVLMVGDFYYKCSMRSFK